MPPTTLSFAMLSDPGLVRTQNEDACAADAGHGIFVVCDGVGGAASGEVASKLASDSFVELMVAARKQETPPADAITKSVESANGLVYRTSQQSPSSRGMATTMVGLIFIPATTDSRGEAGRSAGTVWLANVGDSRCYRLRDGQFEQLTHDHSVVEEQVRAGVITREQASTSPIRNVITRAIGSDEAVEADLENLPAHHGDLYLLCSDGLIRDLSDNEIAGILTARPASNDSALAAVSEKLIRAANEKGGGDNISCVLVYVD